MPLTLNTAVVPAVVAPNQSLDPGEVVVPPATVNTMTEIATFSGVHEPVANSEIDPDTATLVIGAILIFFLIKIALRLLPWILGLSALVVFLKMYGA
jgi:hypothetical protein